MLSILGIFIMGIILNYAYPKSGIIKKYVNIYLIWVGLPLLIFTSLVNSNISIGKPGIICLVLMTILNLIIYWIVSLLEYPSKEKSSLFMTSVYGNAGYIGIPVSFMFFQDKGVGLMSIFVVIVGLLHFSLGIFLSNRYMKKKKKQSALLDMLKFPLFWSFILAFILSNFISAIPNWITIISKSAVYIAPLVIGLAFRWEKIRWSYLHSFWLKFILSPIIFSIVFITNLPLDYKLILMLLSILPPAFATTSIAIRYKFDEEFAAGFTSITTLLFLIIISLINFFI